MQITIVDHPLLKEKMTVLRDANTDCASFRRAIGEVAMLLTFEAAKNIPVEEVPVTTPLCALVTKLKTPLLLYLFCVQAQALWKVY